jgi:hypothetical protein
MPLDQDSPNQNRRIAADCGQGKWISLHQGGILPVIDGAPIVHSAIANVLAECAAIAHLVEDASRIGIVDYELIAERQMIPKCLSRIHRGCTAGGEKVAQHQQGNDTLHDTSP